jgi:hypothetical protein
MEDALEQYLRTEYVKYLFVLYELEKEGFEFGNYPDFEQFIEIYNQEKNSHFH